ncbi:Na+/melibiose symporter [Alkalispirochaeta americana]|uniref:Na+/melibiose symporter n=1 Tax=Alkalispirochaeta americana TaxID=159291 RepID=A0A1N6T5E8_9SPIO|nr:MFS transporter [Alkalispirochaeta americana]SIQ48533.1 Na+/melibiose symporter [Alkalispirochaeta americana]
MKNNDIRAGEMSSRRMYRRSLVIGSGFFTVALIEPMYSAYIPLMLADYLSTSASVGVVLSLLNLIAPLVIPLFSTLSDRTETVLGKRMPYILFFLPLAALSLAVVPLAAHRSFAVLVGALAAMNFFRHAARGPIVSLMPDLVPPRHRSQSNGVINMMAGVAGITSTVLLAPLIAVVVIVPGVGALRRVLPFWIIAVLILFSTAFLFLNVKERKDALPGDGHADDGRPGVRESLREILASGSGGSLPVFGAVLCWFFAWMLVVPFLTMYARDHLGAGEAGATLSYGMLAVSQTLFAIPGGILAARWGRRRMMTLALVLLVLVGLGACLNARAAEAGSGVALFIFWGLLFLLGAAWVILTTNCLPLLWDMGGSRRVGLYTGLYYAASQTALVAGPAAGGGLVDNAGFQGLFLAFSFLMGTAAVFLRISRPGSSC